MNTGKHFRQIAEAFLEQLTCETLQSSEYVASLYLSAMRALQDTKEVDEELVTSRLRRRHLTNTVLLHEQTACKPTIVITESLLTVYILHDTVKLLRYPAVRLE